MRQRKEHNVLLKLGAASDFHRSRRLRNGPMFIPNSTGVLLTAASRSCCATQLSPNQNKRRIIGVGRHSEAHIALEFDSGAVFAALDRLDGVEA